MSTKDLKVNAEVTERIKKKFDAEHAALESRSQLSNSDSPSKKSARTRLRSTFRKTLNLQGTASALKKRSTMRDSSQGEDPGRALEFVEL